MMTKKLLVLFMLCALAFGSVDSAYSPSRYTGDGSTVAFTFDFPVDYTSEVEVVIENSNSETILTETTDYAVSAVNNDYSSGGTVTMVATYTSDDTIVIRRVTPQTQSESLITDTGVLRLSSLIGAYDKLTKICQELQEELNRSFKRAKSDDPTLTSKTEPNDTDVYLYINSDGDLIGKTTVDPGSLSTTSWWITRLGVNPATWFKDFIYDANGRWLNNYDAPKYVTNVTWSGANLNAGMDCNGEWLYVCEYANNRIRLINVSNPEAPYVAGYFTTQNNPRRCQVWGSWLFVTAFGSDAVNVFDLTNNGAGPAPYSYTITTGIGPKDLTIVGSNMYVVCDAGSIEKYDLTQFPDNVRCIKQTMTTGSNPYSVDHYNGVLAVVGGSTTVELFDVATLTSVATTTIGGNGATCEFVGSYLLVTDHTNGNLLVLEYLDGVGTLSQVASLSCGVNPEQVLVAGSVAYVANLSVAPTAGTLTCVDITNIRSPEILSTITLNNTGSGFLSRNNHSLYVSGHTAPYTIDVVELPNIKERAIPVGEGLTGFGDSYLEDCHVGNLYCRYKTVTTNYTVLPTDFGVRVGGGSNVISLCDPNSVKDGHILTISNVDQSSEVTLTNSFNGWSKKIAPGGSIMLQAVYYSGTYYWERVAGATGEAIVLYEGPDIATNGSDWTGASGSTPPTGWTVGTAGIFTIAAAAGQSGDGLEIEHNGTNNDPYIYQLFDTVVNRTYKATCYIKNIDATNGLFRVGKFGDATYYGSTTVSGTSDYVMAETTFTADSTSSMVSLLATTSTSGQSCYFDEVSIVEVPLVADGVIKADSIVAGSDGTTQGSITLSCGSGGDTPGYVKITSPNGTIWYLFVEDDGTLKIHNSIPSDNADGDAIGDQTD